MSFAPALSHAPRFRPWIGARRRSGWGAALVVVALVTPAGGAGQEIPDTVQVADSLQAAVSLQLSVSLQAAPDSAAADTIFYNLPSLDRGLPEGFATGIWEWDRDDIMASAANTIAELMAEVPGLITLLGGDYGTPAAISAFGLGGGGVRLFRDGFEVYPVDGGVADLQRIGLGGITRVRLDRSMGAMIVEMWSYQYDDGRPISVIEAGTGDLDTNMFRGVYADPTSLGGSIAVAMERVDTRGVRSQEGGNRTGTWVRYQLHRQDRAGIALDFRRMGSQTKVPDYAPTLSRTDVTIRARVEVVEGVVAEAYTGKSSLDADDAGVEYELFGGSRSQHGFRLGLEGDGLWARGELRLFGDDELPARNLDVGAGVTREGWGGLAGSLHRATWMGASTSSTGARGWLGPLEGASLFGSWESGTFGGRDGPLLDGTTNPLPPLLPQQADDPPAVAITDRSALRLGGSLSRRGATLSGAVLFVESDLHVPLGTQLDFGSPIEPGGVRRTGWEGWGSLPMLMTGLRLEGSYQRWSQDGPYLPRQVYRGSFEFHRVYKESENLELWWSLGVRGHDAMSVFVADDGQGGPGGLQTVPFYQSWYGRIQVRVVTIRIFLTWENFTLRRNLQNFPGRKLPFARSSFGLRWDMWN